MLVSGADLLDGTPIFDIKPYLPFADSYPEAKAGYAGERKAYRLAVDCDEALLDKLPEEKRAGLIECLRDDPRPSYQEDGRIYGMRFGNFEVKFTVSENRLTVLSVDCARP